MNKSSVFGSEFLTNDSLVPAIVFSRESQGVLFTRIQQITPLAWPDGIGIDKIAKIRLETWPLNLVKKNFLRLFFDNSWICLSSQKKAKPGKRATGKII